MNYTQWKELLKNTPLPAGLVDLDAFDQNIKTIADTLVNKNQTIRIATKSLRVPGLLKRILNYGPPFSGLMCFSAFEIKFLHSQGFDNFLLAYPTVDNDELKVLREVHDQGADVCVVVDSEFHLKQLHQVMNGAGLPFKFIIDVDASLRFFGGKVHLGVRRSPIRTSSQVLNLIKLSNNYSSLSFGGIMVYEAQVAGLGDQNPFKKLLNPIFKLVRSLSIKTVKRLRKEISKNIIKEGHSIKLFNGGGTGSLSFASHEPCLTELTAGSGFFCSHLFDYYSNLNLKPSAFFALRVTRSSDENFVTCQSGGFIASGEPGWDKVPVPYEPKGLSLLSAEGCGEVQTPMVVKNNKLSIGDPVFFRHSKAGELSERLNEYLLISNQGVIRTEKTYRGYGQSYG